MPTYTYKAYQRFINQANPSPAQHVYFLQEQRTLTFVVGAIYLKTYQLSPLSRSMLRLSKMADYGIVLLARVASLPHDQVHTAKELAAASRLPFPTVSKVVKTLVREGLLVSRRGVHGGYSLARAPQDISVVEVIAALEGPVALTTCSAGVGRGCEILHTCTTREPMARLNAIVVGALADVSLADMNRAVFVAPASQKQSMRSLKQ